MATTVPHDPAMDIDLFDPAIQHCPYDAYRTLRDEAPAYRQPGTDIYVVSRYDDVRRVLTDAATFPSSSKETPFNAGSGTIERAGRVTARFAEKGIVPAATLNGRDDPEHKQMRAMFNEAFKPSRIKAIDPFVERLAYDLIDGFIADGHCDWVRQFAVPLPLFIIGEQMGAKRADIWKIKGWTDAFFQRISMMLPEADHMEMVDREIEAQQYFQPIFERMRQEPDESLISVLVNTVIPEWGRTLTDNELHAEMMADTFVGGSETTTNALAAGMKLLIENKDVWHQLKNDPDRHMKTFIEEILRLESPVQSLFRFCAIDTDVGGMPIPAGAMVNVRFAAANRDERAFDRPEKLDLERPRAGAHMAFGSGTHHCLGAPLARRELTWGFTAVVDRFEDMAFAEGKNDFVVRPHFLLRSLVALHIEFEPRKK